MTTIKQRLSYANVMATLALFIALGGSSYAALSLPRNSVGGNQIRAGAVRSSELRDRSVALTDISQSARRALRGAKGPVGPAGPAGPAAAKYFAAVTGAGSFVRGNAAGGGRAGATGTYDLSFAGPTSGCVVAATLGSTDASVAPPGHITTSQNGEAIAVRTYDLAGAPADLPFQLVVTC